MTSADGPEIAEEQPRSPLPPPPPVVFDPALPVPDDAACKALWERFGMLDHIAEHSLVVAQVATAVAKRAKALGMDVDVATVRASAMLHDIAKTYCIRHKGNHSQLGAAWAAEATGNPAVALGVNHHVYWPFDLDVDKYFTPLAVIYADKRVRHDGLVTIESRFADLIERYGVNEYIRGRIEITKAQAAALENLLSDTLEVNLNENAFDSGRVV